MNSPIAPLPCPFCGYGDDPIEEHADGTKWVLHIPDDTKCPLEGSMVPLEEWNRRPNPETQVAPDANRQEPVACSRCKQLRKAYELATYHLSVALEVIDKQLKDRIE